MNRLQTKSSGPGAPTKVPSPGAASSVGPKPPKLAAPRVKPAAASTRMYGKAEPAPPPNPFGGEM